MLSSSASFTGSSSANKSTVPSLTFLLFSDLASFLNFSMLLLKASWMFAVFEGSSESSTIGTLISSGLTSFSKFSSFSDFSSETASLSDTVFSSLFSSASGFSAMASLFSNISATFSSFRPSIFSCSLFTSLLSCSSNFSLSSSISFFALTSGVIPLR